MAEAHRPVDANTNPASPTFNNETAFYDRADAAREAARTNADVSQPTEPAANPEEGSGD